MKPYLNQVFLARRNGFHFSAPLPAKLHGLEALKSSDEEEVLACALTNLQRGHFDVIDRVATLVRSTSSEKIWSSCVTLIAFAAPQSTVGWLVDTYKNDGGDFGHHEVLDAAAAAGMWPLVPAMVAAHKSMCDLDARRFFQDSLSWMLEPEYGNVAYGPEEIGHGYEKSSPFDLVEIHLDFKTYGAEVERKSAELERSLGLQKNTALIEAESLNIENVAMRLRTCLEAGGPGARIEKGRMLLEAMTGLDCRGFYDAEGKLRATSANTIVDEFLRSGDAARFVRGRRYFFGHLIPDVG